jgi:hypothetical protein
MITGRGVAFTSGGFVQKALKRYTDTFHTAAVPRHWSEWSGTYHVQDGVIYLTHDTGFVEVAVLRGDTLVIDIDLERPRFRYAYVRR